MGAFGDWGRMIGRGRMLYPSSPNNQLADDSIEASSCCTLGVVGSSSSSSNWMEWKYMELCFFMEIWNCFLKEIWNCCEQRGVGIMKTPTGRDE